MDTLAATAAAGIPAKSVRYSYDYQGRMISRAVFSGTYSSGSITWAGSADTTAGANALFLYDGFQCVAELNADQSVYQTYVWGLDLSGSLSGAGGVGGLLMFQQTGTGTDAGTYFPTYDGNGNVTGLVKGSDGTQAATYEYGPFGNVLRMSSGLVAADNPFRFSSKWQDYQSDLLYYGYRFYSADTGRWLNRDSRGEQNGDNVYAMLDNDPINSVDLLGKSDINRPPVLIIPGEPSQSSTIIYPPPSANPLYGNQDAAHYATIIGITIGIGANATYEGALRAAYDVAIKKTRSEFRFLAQEGYMTTEEAARQFVEARNNLTMATRSQSSAFARTVAAALKPEKDFKTFEILSQSKTPEQILTSGAARASANTAGEWLTVGGRVCVFAGMTFSIVDIAAAPPGQRAERASEQGGAVAGALSFGYAGGEIGTFGGPIGAGVGFVSGTVLGSFAGAQAGHNYYDAIVNN
jgi:RHS repeat-associated protein